MNLSINPDKTPTADRYSGSERSVSLAYVRLLTDYCQAQGVVQSNLLTNDKLSRALEEAREDERIPFIEFMQLCDRAQGLIKDPDLALKMGQTIRPGHYGIHGHAVMSARTMGECLDRSIRYHAMVHNGGSNVLMLEGDTALMCYQSNMPGMDDLGRFQNELCLSAWMAFAMWVAGLVDYMPLKVSFRHSKPNSIELHQSIFRCPIEFGADRNAIAFSAEFLSFPNPQANPTIVRIMDELSERAVLALRASDEPEWLAQARQYIARQLQSGLPTHDQIAEAIQQTPQGLRNGLKKQGLLMTDLLEQTRTTLAISYLNDPALSLLDISYLLGFSEQSAFTRAFKRWLGKSPGQYRQGLY